MMHHHVIIVGAGPGGLQLGYCLGRANVNYMILERASGAGSFFERLPVHRTLLSINKVNTGTADGEKNLRWDWNSLISDDDQLLLKNYDQTFYPNADSLVQYLRDYCECTKLCARFNCDVRAITRQGDRFVLKTSDGDMSCGLLVIATGTSIPYVPNISGAELTEHYSLFDRAVEGYRNQEVLIVGKGNSAFETAAELLPYTARIHLISPTKLRMAWQSHFVGHLRQINSPFWETFPLKMQNAVLNGSIRRIERASDKYAVTLAFTETGHEVTYLYDRVIMCTGFMFDSSVFADEALPALVHDGRLPALSSHWESVNVPGLFFCGSLMQTSDYKKSASAFVHGIRYNAQTLARLLLERLNRARYPSANVAAEPQALLGSIYQRLRQTSSLWHMHGSLCDAYVFKGTHFAQLQDVPVRMMAEDPRFGSSSRIEFRFTFDNPEDPVERQKFTNFGLLHPALYVFSQGQLISECHMYEDVYAEWPAEDFGFVFERAIPGYISALA